MKSIFFALLLLSFLSTALTTNIVAHLADPKHPDSCNLYDIAILEEGIYKDPIEPCARIYCWKTGMTEFFGCGLEEMFIPGLKYGDYKDKTLNYPECCEREIISETTGKAPGAPGAPVAGAPAAGPPPPPPKA